MSFSSFDIEDSRYVSETSNRNVEKHMLQVIKLSCNRELLGDLHSNGSMKSTRLQLFSFVRDLLQCHRVAVRINNKTY